MPNEMNASSNSPWAIRPDARHLILCEGNDDYGFLNSYIQSSAFAENDMHEVQVMKVDGIPKMRSALLALCNSDGFSQLQSLLLIRDADTNVRSARDNIKGTFSEANLPVPEAEYLWADNGKIKTGFLLMPSCSDHSETGALEDLCWSILSEKHGTSICEEVGEFIHSLEMSEKRCFPHKSKALVHTYFSATDALIAASIGRAADSGAFDWESPVLQPLHDFLTSMI